ncbi:hypothetical protein GCM10009753_44860 [Streptantibioticus ferralitis]
MPVDADNHGQQRYDRRCGASDLGLSSAAWLLESKLAIDSRDDVSLRLLGEMALAAWRCVARNSIRGGHGAHRGRDALTCLLYKVGEAFDAIPASLSLTAV